MLKIRFHVLRYRHFKGEEIEVEAITRFTDRSELLRRIDYGIGEGATWFEVQVRDELDPRFVPHVRHPEAIWNEKES